MSEGGATAWWRRAAERVWLPTADEMAALDRRAVTSGAIPERSLIESAGREIAHQVARRWPSGPVVALAGSGHNGADALVALRCLAGWGRRVRAIRCGSGPPEPDVIAGWPIELEPPDRIEDAARDAAVLLDGILGTGLRSAPRDPQASLIERTNALGRPVVAVDGPSGADFTTGRVPGACIRATLTCTLGWPKLGLLRFPARRRCGDLVNVEIGFPPPDPAPAARAITAPWVRRLLPRREFDAHKGRAGYVTVVAGQRGMAGASVLAARGATRAGAGIVRVVGAPGNRPIVQGAVPEGLFFPWDDEAAVDASVAWSHAVVVGPGLGRGDARRELVGRVLDAAGDRPVLMDADGLNVWEGRTDELAARMDSHILLTPHPGELARLLGTGVADVTDDPFEHARRAAARFGTAVLLKGAPTVVATPGRPLLVSPFTGPALSTGGTGDVLSGVCGALLAAGSGVREAAAAGLFLTGVAAAGVEHPVGHVSPDLWDRLPAARSAVLDGSGGTCGPVNFALPAAEPA